jgi:hypothetical protein
VPRISTMDENLSALQTLHKRTNFSFQNYTKSTICIFNGIPPCPLEESLSQPNNCSVKHPSALPMIVPEAFLKQLVHDIFEGPSLRCACAQYDHQSAFFEHNGLFVSVTFLKS